MTNNNHQDMNKTLPYCPCELCWEEDPQTWSTCEYDQDADQCVIVCQHYSNINGCVTDSYNKVDGNVVEKKENKIK